MADKIPVKVVVTVLADQTTRCVVAEPKEYVGIHVLYKEGWKSQLAALVKAQHGVEVEPLTEDEWGE